MSSIALTLRHRWLAVSLVAFAAWGVFTGCGQSKKKQPPTAWVRAQFQPGGGSALVVFAVYGKFNADFQIDGHDYRTLGIPAGVSLKKFTRAQRPALPFTDGPVGVGARKENSALFETAAAAAECMVLQGEVPDPGDLNYLRDAIGVVTYLLDHGGEVVMDPQQSKLYDRPAWRRGIFDPGPANWQRHVAIVASDDEAINATPRRWLRTHGLRKFGRPDLSLGSVEPAHESAIVELFTQIITRQVEGARWIDGKEWPVPSMPFRVTGRVTGALTDPDFNNTHVQLKFVEGK